MRLSEFRGQIVVLDFWASWCAPCIKKIDPLNRALETYHNDAVVVIGVNMDQNREAAITIVKQKSVPWRSWSDQPENGSIISNKYRVLDIPAIYFLDANGIIQANANRDKPRLASVIEKILADAGANPNSDEP